MDKKSISNVCFVASLVSVAASIAAWALMGGDDPAHAERFGIFIGLWAPTLMGLSNYYKEYPMTNNLYEFIIMVTLVFSTSGFITWLRWWMSTLGESKDTKEYVRRD